METTAVQTSGSVIEVLETTGEDETRAVGRRLGETLAPGAFLGIAGPLGAGKTRLVQGLCDGLGVDPREVMSPTFALVNTYRGRHPVLHADLYRIEDAEEVEATGMLDEAATSVTLVEWIDRVPELVPEGGLWADIEDLGGDRRRITLRRHGGA